jgi:hypothetical protein
VDGAVFFRCGNLNVTIEGEFLRYGAGVKTILAFNMRPVGLGIVVHPRHAFDFPGSVVEIDVEAAAFLGAMVFHIGNVENAPVDGCRPGSVRRHLDPSRWGILHGEKHAAFGVSSEAIVARSV